MHLDIERYMYLDMELNIEKVRDINTSMTTPP